MRANLKQHGRAVGAVSLFTGLFMTAFAFAGSAAGERQAATSSAACSDGGWTDTVTVVNGLSDQGPATVSGTGTALDGQDLPAGGGQQTVTLRQPLSVKSVTVSGRLKWTTTKFSASFHTTGHKPSHCGADAALTTKASSGLSSSSLASSSTAARTRTVSSSVAGASVADSSTTAADTATTAANTATGSSASGSGTTTKLGRLAPLVPLADSSSDPSVTLCHATSATKNPYVQITVDAAGAFNGHLGHTGPVWMPGDPNSGGWGDIIPPFTYLGQTYSLNWPAGQDIFNADCGVPPTTVTATVPTTVTATVPTTVTATVPVTETVTVPVTVTVTLTSPVTQTVTEVKTEVRTVTVTQTVPGCVIGVDCPTATVTEFVTLTPDTVTVTEETTPETETETVTNCPPGAKTENGSLAFTGSNNATMSMIGGALTAGGLVCLIMGRRRSTPRAH